MTIRQLLPTILLAAVSIGRAGVVYNNFGSTTSFDPGNGWLVDGGQAGGQQIGAQFTPTATTPLINVQMALGILFSDLTQSPLSVYLAADDGGLPGTDLADLTLDGTVGPFPPSGIVSYVCTTCPNLNAGTPYWLVASIPNLSTDYFNSEVAWNWNTTGDYSTGTNLAFNDTQLPNPGWQLGNNSELMPAFGVNAPEPGSMLLVGLGLLASGRLLKRRRPLQ